MKKSGILNGELMGQLTQLRHKDKVLLCDVGFPIPVGAKIVDVSLVAGVPDMMTTIQAVLNEIIVEECAVSGSMADRNPEYYLNCKNIFIEQTFRELPGQEFVSYASDAKLFVRTGETKPYSNILLVSASGVPEVCKKYDISF